MLPYGVGLAAEPELMVISSYFWVIKIVIWLATASHSAGCSGGQN